MEGNITEMLLDISKLKNTGWTPRYNSREAIIISAKRADKGTTADSIVAWQMDMQATSITGTTVMHKLWFYPSR